MHTEMAVLANFARLKLSQVVEDQPTVQHARSTLTTLPQEIQDNISLEILQSHFNEGVDFIIQSEPYLAFRCPPKPLVLLKDCANEARKLRSVNSLFFRSTKYALDRLESAVTAKKIDWEQTSDEITKRYMIEDGYFVRRN